MDPHIRLKELPANRRDDETDDSIVESAGCALLHRGATRSGSFSNVTFVADDVQKTCDELAARGVEFVKPPKTEPWGTSAIMKDLDGNVFVISSK